MTKPNLKTLCSKHVDLEKEAHAAGFQIGRLARRLGISSRTLRRRTMQLGKPLRVTLQEMRLRKALVLLAEGLNVNETSDAVGYSHAGDFTRAFRKLYGIPPSRAGLLPPNIF